MPSNNWVYSLPEAQRPKNLGEMVQMTADHYGVDPGLAYAVFNQESGGVHQDERGVRTGPPSPTTVERAKGIFQVLPSTAHGYNLNPDDPLDNIETGIRYLKEGLDANKGSARGALAYYHGGPDLTQHGPLTQRYVDEVYPQLLLQHQGADQQRAWNVEQSQRAIDAQKGKEPTIRPANAGESRRDWMVEHFPRLSAFTGALVDSHDLRTRAGRENTAGTAGDIGGSWIGGRLGGTAGAAAGTAAEPGGGTAAGLVGGAYGGRRVGGPIGAFVLGAGEHALEETGLPERAARYFGYQGPPEPPPDPNSSMLGRTLHAGWSQAWPAAVAQGVHAAAAVGGKRVLQSEIARGAAETFEKANMRDMNVLYDHLDTLRTQARELTAARNRAGRAVRQGVTDRIQELQDSLKARLGRVGTQGTRDIADATTAADAEQRALSGIRDAGHLREGAAKDLGARGVQVARDEATKGVELAKANAGKSMAGFVEAHTAEPPSGIYTEPEAGAATAVAFEHGKKTVLDPAGQAITAASQAVEKPVDYRPLKEEARGILERLLRPRDAAKLAAATEEGAAPAAAQSFLTRDASGNLVKPAAPAAAAAAAVPVPTTNSELDALLSQVDDAQAAEIAKHPAMRIVKEILDGPDSGPHILGHQWKSDLGHALEQSGAYGRVTNSVADNVTKKLTGSLRTALRDPGYDAATAAYEKLTPFFYKGPHAKLVAQIANHEVGPETIVQAIKPDQSTFTKQLVDGLLAHGGDAGRDAVARLQSAWWHRNVLQGGVEKMGDAVAKLEQRPEFMKALFGDQAGRDLVQNTKAVAAALKKKAAEGAMGRGMAEATGHWGVRAAERTRDAGIEEAKSLTAREIEEASARVGRSKAGIGDARVERAQALEDQRLANTDELREAQREGRTEVEATRRFNEDKRLSTAQELQEHRRDMRLRGQPDAPERAEERAFGKSSLGKTVESPGDALGNLLVNHVVPQLGWMKVLVKGAKTDDIIRYAVHSKARTRALVAALVKFPLHEPVPQITSAAIKSPGATAAVVSGKSRAQRDKEEQARAARWNVGAAPPPR